jgi:hypothetical protein
MLAAGHSQKNSSLPGAGSGQTQNDWCQDRVSPPPPPRLVIIGAVGGSPDGSYQPKYLPVFVAFEPSPKRNPTRSFAAGIAPVR